MDDESEIIGGLKDKPSPTDVKEIVVVETKSIDISTLSHIERENLFLQYIELYPDIDREVWLDFKDMLENQIFRDSLKPFDMSSEPITEGLIDINIIHMFNVMKHFNIQQFFIPVIKEFSQDKYLKYIKKRYTPSSGKVDNVVETPADSSKTEVGASGTRSKF